MWTRSVMEKAFANDRLRTDSFGPMSEFLCSFPNANCPPDAAGTKAAVLNHWLGPGLLTPVGPTTFGNQLQPLPHPVKVALRLLLVVTVKGFPLWAIKVPAKRHPPAISLTRLLLFR